MSHRRSISPPSPASQRGHYMSSLGPNYPDIDFNPSPVEQHMRQAYYPQDEQDLTTQRDWVSPSATEDRDELQQPQRSKFTTEYSPLVTVEQHFDDQKNCSKIESAQAHQPFIRTKISYETIIADILCIGIPCMLLVFVILLSSKSGKEATTSDIASWYGAASMLSTLFPILFAAITGRSMTQVARWKLEEGASIGSLEQLLGSRTVGGAVLTQYHLRAFNFLGIGILILWAMSPVGSQAILRLVEPRIAKSTTAGKVVYFDHLWNAVEGRLVMIGEGYETWDATTNGTIDMMNTLYGAMVLVPSSTKNSGMDLWGNVKIPRLSPDSTDEWQNITTVSPVVYSSLLGIPVSNISAGNTTFNVESSYIDLECDQVEVWERNPTGFMPTPPSTTSQGYLNFTYLDSLSYANAGRVPQIGNGSFQGYDVKRGANVRQTSWSIGLDRFVDPDWSRRNYRADTPVHFENETDIDVGPTRLMFQAYMRAALGPTPVEHAGSYCNVKQRYLESRISCEKTDPSARQNCTAVSQRWSHRYRINENLSILNWPYSFRFLTAYWPLSTGPKASAATGTLSDQDILLQFLFDPTMENVRDTVDSRSPSLALQNISATDFSIRLSQAMNTYIQLRSMNFMSLNLQNADGGIKCCVQTATSNGEVVRENIVFGISRVWSAFSMIACIILLAGGITSSVFAHLAVGPEILGYATSLMRKTTLELPREKEGLEGTELAFELRNSRVRYGFSTLEGAVMVVGAQDNVARIKDVLK
ncbi:unnamed protein product [Clonostachys rhizophaga]|uniref:Uncharacterized protein n=1 Tax=Clonostachys rhizophaga TaxID=160324 RepID=A0A9N9YAZ2_9HYPO|nr:unnamed protein product [Clonostachys rhizophaga]